MRGQGWKFPVKVDKATGKFMMSEGEEDIHEAIILILKTAKKERIMRPGFGSNIHHYVLEQSDSSTLALLEEEVKTAIENWEPRVTDVTVDAYNDGTYNENVIVDVSYRVISLDRAFKKSILLES
ncbi:GPW/gp25 family protein [Pseudobacteroides cellulosolvens]|nr:GPW/gp25 family protein [Pseudobacteroides cellulosolvens]